MTGSQLHPATTITERAHGHAGQGKVRTMDGMPLRMMLRLLFGAGFFALVACGQVNSTKASVEGPARLTPGGSSGTPSAPSGGSGGTVVNSAGFFINITGSSNADAVQYLHQADAAYGADIGTTNFSTECKIADGSAVGGNLVCVAEVEELDLYFNNLTVQYHVPSDMCTYFRVRPYWFYAYAPGNGPSTASHEVRPTGITDILNTVNGVATCQYDYTSQGGPNCCIGSYNHLINTYDAGGSLSTVVNQASWGGSVGNCIAGAGSMMDGFSKNSIGVPISNVYYVEGSGLNNTITLTAPINSKFGTATQLFSNLWTANFYTPSVHVSGKPPAMLAPPAVTTIASGITPNDVYDFQCLDAAEEFNQRIRLFIREWNQAPISEGGDPDVTGTEPIYNTPINDRSDWTDFGENYPASSL